MLHIKLITTALAAGGLVLLSGSAFAQDQGEYVLIGSHIDNVRQQTTIFQLASQ